MADLGRKHVCFKCSSRFYDLKKPRAICPKCGADQADAPVAPAAAPAAPAKRVPKMVDPEEEAPAPEEGEEAAAAAEGELDVEGDEEMPKIDEDLDENTGEDSYD
jgi:uncharacterized protein (TIGR02300 family)